MIKEFWSLLYPRTCAACGDTMLANEQQICIQCLGNLPKTNFHLSAINPLDTIFRGRLMLSHISSLYYFKKEGPVQNVLHEIKYRGNKAVAEFLGTVYGTELLKAQFLNDCHTIVPVPLHPAKFKLRGYNQSEEFAKGLAAGLNMNIDCSSLVRTENTASQTRKSRFDRWDNVSTVFEVQAADKINGKHIVMVDDVLTTGATLEACGNALLAGGADALSVITLACALNN